MKSKRIPQEVYAGGHIRKFTEVDEDGVTDITNWDPEPFLERNKQIRELNTRVDTRGDTPGWHFGASIPTPIIEMWYKEELKKGGQAHAARVTADPKWLLARCKEPDYQKLLVSDKV